MGSNRRLAVDKVMIAGLRALDAAGFKVHEGEEVMEHARVIKGHDDILAIVAACIHARCLSRRWKKLLHRG